MVLHGCYIDSDADVSFSVLLSAQQWCWAVRCRQFSRQQNQLSRFEFGMFDFQLYNTYNILVAVVYHPQSYTMPAFKVNVHGLFHLIEPLSNRVAIMEDFMTFSKWQQFAIL